MDLDKSFDESQVRRAFAAFGKIQSFRLVNKPEFTTNIAYVAYTCPRNAKLAFDNVVSHSNLGQFRIEWHKQKLRDAGKLISDISSQLEKLE
jgi:RNA recognition motif-containing protein